MLERMPFAESDLQAARSELERVLASPGFTRNERLGRFLRFVVEKHLEGRDDEVKEYVLAVEVFGRSADYDPKQDSIVRAEFPVLSAAVSDGPLRFATDAGPPSPEKPWTPVPATVAPIPAGETLRVRRFKRSAT